MNTYMKFAHHETNRNLARREIYAAEVGMWECLKKARKYLTEKEYAILKMRTHDHKTLEEVGRELLVTRERIRQLEAKAHEKWKILAEKEDIKNQ